MGPIQYLFVPGKYEYNSDSTSRIFNYIQPYCGTNKCEDCNSLRNSYIFIFLIFFKTSNHIGLLAKVVYLLNYITLPFNDSMFSTFTRLNNNALTYAAMFDLELSFALLVLCAQFPFILL